MVRACADGDQGRHRSGRHRGDPRGATPKLVKPDEQAIYDFAIELITKRRVSDATFERAKKEIGETSVIDLVGIIGYYSLVSVTLNAFELPLPEGEKLPFGIK